MRTGSCVRRRGTSTSSAASSPRASTCASGTDRVWSEGACPPPAESTSWDELAELAACEARPVLRIERLADELRDLDALRADVAAARGNGFAALKTIAAYRGGLDRGDGSVLAALEANEATGEPLPLQVHTGFGDSDLFMPHADPG